MKLGNMTLGKNPVLSTRPPPESSGNQSKEHNIRLMFWELLLLEVLAGLLLVIEPGKPTDDMVEGAKTCAPNGTADLFREEVLQVVLIISPHPKARE